MRLTALTLLVSFCVVAFNPAAVAETPFLRGDSNQDGRLDLSDALNTFGALFRGGSLRCVDAADHDDNGNVELTDGIATLRHLFRGARAPAPPYPRCGVDPTPDALGCEEYTGQGCDTGAGSPLPEFLGAISTDGDEPCCFGALGTYLVGAGECESLGGQPASGGDCAPGAAAADPIVWSLPPPSMAIDPFFEVEVLVAPTFDEAFDVVVFELVVPDRNGDELGAVPVASVEAGTLGVRALGVRPPLRAAVDLWFAPPGEYSMRATLWKRDVASGAGGVMRIGNEEEEVPPGSVHDELRAVSYHERPFQLMPQAPVVPDVAAMADIAGRAPALDPAVESALQQLEALVDEVNALAQDVTSPEIDNLRRRIREKQDEIVRLLEEIARRRAAQAERDAAIAALENELALLVLVNRYLDTYFDDSWLDLLKELIRRREGILDDTEQDDRDALQEALDDKRARLDEINDEIDDKQDELDQARQDHADMKDRIRATFLEALRTQDQYIGTIDIQDGSVEYRMNAVWVSPDGSEARAVAPSGSAYREKKAELDELIEEYEDLWEKIQDCEAQLQKLEEEKEWLEKNIAKLESGAGEVDEIDEVLDAWFDVLDDPAPPQAPHLDDLLEALEAAGAGWLADMLRELFGNVPRTCEELEAFTDALQALRDEKHAREDAIRDEIDRLRRENDADDTAIGDAEDRIAELEDEIRDLVDRLRRAIEEAIEEARAAAEEARRRAEEEAERHAEDERMRELLERARAGDEDALAELAQMVGLGVLDELFPGMGLGGAIGGLLTAANVPECLCKILTALKDLLGSGPNLSLVYANEYIRQWRECAGLPTISSVEIGASKLADAVDRMPREAKRRAAAAVARVMKLNDC